MRSTKTYSGDLMQIGRQNEEIILNWLNKNADNILDFRDFKLAQRIDVDFGIETIDGQIILAEIKADKWIKEGGNFLFELYRINHFIENKWFYLGWGYRSPAQKLIVRNPTTNETFIFDFLYLRKFIGKYIANIGRNLNIQIIETDEQKTTFVLLIPMEQLKDFYKKYHVE